LSGVITEPGVEGTVAFLPLEITDDDRRALIVVLTAGLAGAELTKAEAEPLDPWASAGTRVKSLDGLQHGALDGTYGADDNAPWVGVVWRLYDEDGEWREAPSSRVWIDGLVLDDDVAEETPKADTFSALKKGKAKK